MSDSQAGSGQADDADGGVASPIPGPVATEDGQDRRTQAVRVRVTATERVGSDQTWISYEIRLPGGRPLIGSRVSLHFPSSMSELEAALSMAVREALADAGLPRQLVTTLAFD